MLKELFIKNYALIKDLKINPDPELNIITGETGAGKSIMLGAMGLLLGNRADTKALYDDSEKCLVEGKFDVSDYNLESTFVEEDLDFEAECIIRREISPKGKSRAFINDTPVTLDVLKMITNHLVDIHSQHDTLLLGNDEYQLNIIDLYASNQPLLNTYQTHYESYRKAKREYEELLKEASDLRQSQDFDAFQLEELEKANLDEVSLEELEDHLKTLENAEEIKTNLNQSVALYRDSEFSVSGALHEIKSLIKKAAGFSSEISGLFDRMEGLSLEMDDVIGELERQEDLIEFDQEKINEVQAVLSNIYRLQQKYGVLDIAELIKIREELQEKTTKTQNLDEEVENAREAMESSEKELDAKAQQLSDSRKNVFDGLIAELEALLADLGMPDSSVDIRHEASRPSKSGVDDIKILFSANKGVRPGEIKNMASGGEFSRLMFCVKSILAKKISLPTIIFDEIDSGISGEIASKMAGLMKQMADVHQVITISHLPQFAVQGNSHYFVYKVSDSEKAESRIKLLEQSERIEEVAKMIGGDSPSELARENAKEMLMSK